MKTSVGIFYSRFVLVTLIVGALVMASCVFGRHRARHDKKPSKTVYTSPSDGYQEEAPSRRIGIASWYGPGFHGKLTASGEPYNMYDMTCAHKTFPMGTKLRVTSIQNGKSVVVTVNDRGPYVAGREIDLSYAAAKELGVIGPGTAKVEIEPLGHDVRYIKYNKSYSIEKGPFTVQVASFSERFNAVQLLKDLKLRYSSRDPYIFEANQKGRRLYRVRVGKLRTREDAQSLADALIDDGYKVMVCTYEDQI
jgi:rare lipoprotein A